MALRKVSGGSLESSLDDKNSIIKMGKIAAMSSSRSGLTTTPNLTSGSSLGSNGSSEGGSSNLNVRLLKRASKSYRDSLAGNSLANSSGSKGSNITRTPSRGACGVPLGLGFGQWLEFFDDDTDRSYYYNLVTNETTWVKPKIKHMSSSEASEDVWLVEDLDKLVQEVVGFRGTSSDSVTTSLTKGRMALQVSLWKSGKTTSKVRRKKFSDLCDALDDLVYAAENGASKTRLRIVEDDGLQLCIQVLKSREHWELWVVVMYLLAVVAEDPACRGKVCANESILAVPFEFLGRSCTAQESDVATKLLLALLTCIEAGTNKVPTTIMSSIAYALRPKNLRILVQASNKLRGIAVDRLDKILRMLGGPQVSRVIHMSVLTNNDLFTLLDSDCNAVLRATSKEIAERASRGLLVPLGAPRLSGALISGWLFKDSKWANSWTKRWYVLLPDCLLEYSCDPKSPHNLGDPGARIGKPANRRIDLRGCSIVKSDTGETSGGDDAFFTIYIPKRPARMRQRVSAEDRVSAYASMEVVNEAAALIPAICLKCSDPTLTDRWVELASIVASNSEMTPTSDPFWDFRTKAASAAVTRELHETVNPLGSVSGADPVLDTQELETSAIRKKQSSQENERRGHSKKKSLGGQSISDPRPHTASAKSSFAENESLRTPEKSRSRGSSIAVRLFRGLTRSATKARSRRGSSSASSSSGRHIHSRVASAERRDSSGSARTRGFSISSVKDAVFKPARGKRLNINVDLIMGPDDLGKKGRLERIMALCGHKSIIVRESAARILASAALSAPESRDKEEQIRKTLVEDDALVALLGMLQEARDDRSATTGVSGHFSIGILAAEVIASTYLGGGESVDGGLMDMTPTLVAELVSLARLHAVKVSRSAAFTVCRALSRILGVARDVEAKREMLLMFSRSGGPVVLAMMRDQVFSHIHGPLLSTSESDQQHRSVGATPEDDRHKRSIGLALTDEITSILNLVDDDAHSSFTLSTLESQVKRASRKRSSRKLMLNATGDRALARPLSQEYLALTSFGGAATSPTHLPSTTPTAGSTPSSNRTHSVKSQSSIDDLRADAVEVTNRSSVQSVLRRALAPHQSMQLLQIALRSLEGHLEGNVLDQCHRIGQCMSVDAASMYSEIDRLLISLSTATRKAEAMRSLVDEWSDPEIFFLRTLYTTLSTREEEDLESIFSGSDTRSRTASRLDKFERACLSPVGSKNYSVAQTSEKDQIISVRDNRTGYIPDGIVKGSRTLCSVEPRNSLATFTRYTLNNEMRPMSPQLHECFEPGFRLHISYQLSKWLHVGSILAPVYAPSPGLVIESCRSTCVPASFHESHDLGVMSMFPDEFGRITLDRIVKLCTEKHDSGKMTDGASLWGRAMQKISVESVHRAIIMATLYLHRNLVSSIVNVVPRSTSTHEKEEGCVFDVVISASPYSLYADSALSLRTSSSSHLLPGEYDYPVLLSLPQARMPIHANVLEAILNHWDIVDIDSCIRRYMEPYGSSSASKSYADALIAAITHRYMRIQSFVRDLMNEGTEAEVSLIELVHYVVPLWKDDWRASVRAHSSQDVASVWKLVAPPISPLAGSDDPLL